MSRLFDINSHYFQVTPTSELAQVLGQFSFVEVDPAGDEFLALINETLQEPPPEVAVLEVEQPAVGRPAYVSNARRRFKRRGGRQVRQRAQRLGPLPPLPGCWNCGGFHHYNVCRRPRTTFCRRCGIRNVTVMNCPRCMVGWRAQGPLIQILRQNLAWHLSLAEELRRRGFFHHPPPLLLIKPNF